jgi:hypothetical protein
MMQIHKMYTIWLRLLTKVSLMFFIIPPIIGLSANFPLFCLLYSIKLKMISSRMPFRRHNGNLLLYLLIMPPVSDIAEKVKEQAGDAAVMLKAAFAGIRGWGEKLWDLLPEGIREKLPWLEDKIGFILAAMALVLIILLLVLIPAGLSRGRVDMRSAGPKAGEGMFKAVPIPPEELFLPTEPDLLPGVILEREQRDVWTAEDAEPYWYNPLEQGEEEWREQVEQVIDELLERVP